MLQMLFKFIDFLNFGSIIGVAQSINGFINFNVVIARLQPSAKLSRFTCPF